MDANLARQREEFLKAAHQRLGKTVTESDCGPDGLDLVLPGEDHALYEDVDGPSFPDLDDELPEAEVSGDYYVNAHVMLPVGPTEERARVLHRKRDSDGNPIGVAHRNPVLDTWVYEVQFPDGRTEEVAANVIAQALYSQCDPDGNEFVLLDSIVDWRKDNSAVNPKDQARIVDGKKVIKRSTKGWELCCEWRHGSTSWQSLKDLKESHPLQVAEFAYMAGIAGEPAYNWWVGWVIKKRDRIISLVKRRSARYLKRNHKFGIELPKTVEEALEIDRRTNTTFWGDAIKKEMQNVRIAFDILEDGSLPPQDYQFVRCHMVFDVKMEDFRRKARLVAGGHMTKAPATLTYASVVSRETVRLALTVAADLWALMF
jgi:hypothetical protein